MAEKTKGKGKPVEKKAPEKPAGKPTGKPPAVEKPTAAAPVEKVEEKPAVEKPVKEKKPKVKKKEKGAYTRYKVDEKGLTRLRPYCERCGQGYFMADHGNRYSCGHCGFTRYKQA